MFLFYRTDNQNVEHRHRNPSIASESSLPSFLFNCFADEEMNSTSIPVCLDDKYEFATHVIKVKRSGQVTEVRSLWELEGKRRTIVFSLRFLLLI